MHLLLYKTAPEFHFSLHHHLEVSLPEDVAKMEEEFAEVVRSRGPDFTFFQGQILSNSFLCN
jgi:hypothetical protein